MRWSEAVSFSQDDKRDSLIQRSTLVKQATGTPPDSTIAALSHQPTCYESWLQGSFTIVPEGNVFIDMWDMVVIIALCVTALLLPWEVALITSPPHNLFVLDRCIDGIFWIDMICSFNLAFASQDSRGLYEKRPMHIAKHYMAFPFSQNFEAGWFWPDLLTLIPWEMVSSVKGMRSLRLVRVLRLVRMFRLVRVIKLFKRWHTHVGFSFSMVKVLSTLMVTLLLVHWLACLWAHLGQNQEAIVDSEREVTTWLEAWAGAENDIDSLSDSKVYINSLYFCCVVLTTVGFGDITPKADIEYIAMVVTIFVTALTWAWVVANVVKVITEADIFGNIFNERMDDLNRLMGTRGVEKSLRFQVRKHLYAATAVRRVRHETASISWLSSSLQGELAIESGIERSLQTVWYLRRTTPMVITELAVFFTPDIFSPHEFIMDPNSLTVIQKGTCTKRGALLQKNAVFGEDMILATEELKDTAMPKTMTFVEVLRLSKINLAKVCQKYKEFDRKIRKAQIKLAVWRSFIYQANKIKRAQAAMQRKLDQKSGEVMRRNSRLSLADIVKMLDEQDVKRRGGWTESMVQGSTHSEKKTGAIMFSRFEDLKTLLEERELTARRFSQRVEKIGQKLQERRAETENTFDGLEMRLMDTWKEMQKTEERIFRSRSNGLHGAG